MIRWLLIVTLLMLMPGNTLLTPQPGAKSTQKLTVGEAIILLHQRITVLEEYIYMLERQKEAERERYRRKPDKTDLDV